jgi:hypothetical protein
VTDEVGIAQPPVSPIAPGVQSLGLERRPRLRVRSTSVFDWIAFVLAFLVPPVGILASVVALVAGWRRRGWTSGIARASLAASLALSAVVGVGGLALGSVLAQGAAHNAVIASSRTFCQELASQPGMVDSSTFAWPALGDTIDSSIAAMQKYATTWAAIARVAPDGIRSDAVLVSSTAEGIVAQDRKTRVLDDAGNVAQMQQVAAASGIPAWVDEYCK